MINFKNQVAVFFSLVESNKVEIYNEFSLQHELGIFLRSVMGGGFKIQFERPTNYFGLTTANLRKKEIDITIFSLDKSEKYAFELKYPRNGQYPEQMFEACKDIFFLEKLKQQGFYKCFFIDVGDNELRWGGRDTSGIYRFFRRKDVPIHGIINKPTGKDKDKFPLMINGNYQILWNTIDSSRKYALVEI